MSPLVCYGATACSFTCKWNENFVGSILGQHLSLLRKIIVQAVQGLLLFLKGSASQLNKLVLKDSPNIQKLIGTNLFPRSRHQYIYCSTSGYEP